MIEKPPEFLNSLYDEEGEGFRFTVRSRVTLLSTCFGVMLAYLVGRMEILDATRVAAYIGRCQRRDGLYVDPLFTKKDLLGAHDDAYFHWQCTFFSLIALDMLGSGPGNPLRFLAPFTDAASCDEWFAERNWNNFWYSSNEIMFLLYFFSYSLRRTGPSSGPWEDRLQQMLDLLDGRQDPVTGYWGDAASANPANGMFGAAHIYLFYDYHRRPVNHCEAIVSQTLALQHANGLFGSREGGGCEDYDGVEVLARMLGRVPGRDQAIAEAMNRCCTTISRQGKRLGGGYPYRFAARTPLALVKKWLSRLMGTNTYLYSGWRLMSADIHVPDLWATYFRTLTIAVAEAALRPGTSSPYRGYDLPGWGYLGRAVLHPQEEYRS